MFTKNKNTTIAGILTFVTLLVGQLIFMFDALPETNPDWGLVIAGLFVLIGLFKAKDSGSLSLLSTDNKNTTIAGILAFVALLAGQLTFQFDSDPVTTPDWSLIIAGLFVLLGLLRAKDAATA